MSKHVPAKVQIVIADTDALLALTLENDVHHEKAVASATLLAQQGATVIFPVTVFPEAITTLKRAFNQPEKAHLINKQYQEGVFHVEYITPDIMLRASTIFATTMSKQNTLFDAIVAATAEKLHADAIFSFDDWYPKLGFQLVSN